MIHEERYINVKKLPGTLKMFESEHDFDAVLYIYGLMSNGIISGLKLRSVEPVQ